MWLQHVLIADQKPTLLVSVSSLSHGTTEEDIVSYFERQGDEVEVCSVQIHESGQEALLKLVGLTEEGTTVSCTSLTVQCCTLYNLFTEQTRLQRRKQHKINRQGVTVEIVSQLPPDFHQAEQDSTISSQVSSEGAECDTLEVSNLPSKATEETLDLYFESPKSGGCEDAVKSVTIVQPGIAHVQFHDPQGKYLCKSDCYIYQCIF